MRQSGFSTILLIIIVLIIAAGGFYWYQSSYFHFGQVDDTPPSAKLNNKPTPTPLPLLNPSQKAVQSIITEYNAKNNPKFDMQPKGYLWWITKDKWNIIDNQAASASLGITESNIEQAGIKNKTAEQVNHDVETVLTLQGYSLDILNSSKSEYDEEYYDYIRAFTKDQMKCTLLTDPDVTWDEFGDNTGKPGQFHISINCSDQIEARTAEQLPYLKGLNDHQNAINEITKSGDYARLGLHARRTGHAVIGKMVNGKFTKIFAGQDMPLCADMDKNGVPKEIYNNCYENDRPRF